MTATSRHRGPRRRFLVPAAVAVLATGGLASMSSTAFFTDTASVTSNTFTTGTVSLSATPATAAVALGTMAPGDVKYGTVQVANNGSLSERYAMLSTADNADGKGLAAALQMVVKTGVTSCDAAGFSSGTQLYSGVLGSTAGTKVFGDVAQGQQTGDRTLTAGASEGLCIQVTLPTTAGNTLQGSTTNATFEFDGEQTTNNP